MKKILILAAFAAQVLSFSCVKADFKDTIKKVPFAGFNYVKKGLGFNDTENMMEAITKIDPTNFNKFLDSKTTLSEDYKKDLLAQLSTVKAEWESSRTVFGRSKNLLVCSAILFLNLLVINDSFKYLKFDLKEFKENIEIQKEISNYAKQNKKRFRSMVLIHIILLYCLNKSESLTNKMKKLFIPKRKIEQLEQIGAMIEAKKSC